MANNNMKTWLSAYWDADNIRYNITDEDIRENVEWASGKLDYHCTRGIPVCNVDTHSLRSGGAMALALSGYSDTQIQKMGRWKGASFKEYIHEDLACYSKGMSKDMKRTFGFVNIAAGANHEIMVDVTNTMMVTDYNTHAASA